MRARLALVALAALGLGRGAGAVPVAEDAPWPLFRRDSHNSGRSPILARYHGDTPWSFATGKGIFATPVIDAEGTIYIGSADHVFRALRPDGTEKWRFSTGEIIDSAAALPRSDPDGRASVVVPSGDGHLYKLWTESGRVAWSFDARVAPRRSFNDWFEGNVAIGPDGTFYAGNTNFNYYAVSPEGRLRWVHPTDANAWSMAAFGADGSIFWGSLDTFVRAVRPDGSLRWRKRTLGMIAASAAVGSDGTVYVGSFDGSLYALDGETGRTRWSFRTGDHLYASAALGVDDEGRTSAIYLGSTDGIFYALGPDGELLWTYPAGDPIRSSAALGGSPGVEGGIAYFGCGNGRLFALHARDGTQRWSFDTTASAPELADRNDLNASVALGRTGLYVGSESGRVWYVPYDWCLHARDPRCATDPAASPAREKASLVYVTPGGSVRDEPPSRMSPVSIHTFRLDVPRRESADARFCNWPFFCPEGSLVVRTEPPARLEVERSPDGRHLHVVPREPLEAGASYRLHVEADWHGVALRVGNLAIAGRRRGRVTQEFTLRTAPAATESPSLAVGSEEVSAFEWTRPAIPIPTMLPSLNQIGFDYMDWVVGAAHVGAPDATGTRRAILWATGARRDASGTPTSDPESPFLLPLSGTVRDGDFVLEARDFTLAVTGIPIPFRSLELRGRFGPGLAVEPGASLLARTDVLSIPTFGPYLVLAGLANDLFRELVAVGTFLTRPYTGAASRRPPGVEVESVTWEPPARGRAGTVTATLHRGPGVRLPEAERRGAILLLDAARERAVALPYRERLGTEADPRGDLARVRLEIPPDAELPDSLEAIVLVDVFPLARVRLGEP